MKALISLVIFALLVIAYSGIYIIPEGRQVVLTQFGKPVGDPVTEPGLYFKTPFIQDLQYVDARILSWDGHPNQIPTKDKKYIYVDTTARWRITNALKFIQTVQNERGAKARLDSILDANTRDVISNNNLVEAVRNSNAIYDQKKLKKEQIAEQESINSEGKIVDDEITGEIDKIQNGREQLSLRIVSKSESELKEFGIELIDVQLRRISYEESVERKVYERMTSERRRFAEKIRSFGHGEKAKIEGRLSRDLQEIESIAYRKSQKVRGEAEAKSVAIYAKALKADPSFYEFMRTLESYDKSLQNAKFLFSSENKFLKHLDN